jgi:hypothetical protein
VDAISALGIAAKTWALSLTTRRASRTIIEYLRHTSPPLPEFVRKDRAIITLKINGLLIPKASR